MNLVGNDLLESGRYIAEHSGHRPRAGRDRRGAARPGGRPGRAARCRGVPVRRRAARTTCARAGVPLRAGDDVLPALRRADPGRAARRHLRGGRHRRRRQPGQAAPRALPEGGRDPRRRPGGHAWPSRTPTPAPAPPRRPAAPCWSCQNHVPVLPGDRRVFVDTLAGVHDRGDLPVPGAPAPGDGRRGPRHGPAPLPGQGLRRRSRSTTSRSGSTACAATAAGGRRRRPVVTQREHPVLARVRPGPRRRAPPRLRLVVQRAGPRRGARRHHRPHPGRDASSTSRSPSSTRTGAVAWFGALLGEPVRLVARTRRHAAHQPGSRSGQTVLSDEGTVSLHSEASLARLNDALGRRGHAALPADRFRANIVVDGCPAHAEDEASTSSRPATSGWRSRGSTSAARSTTVDQRPGERRGPEPLRTLADYRRVDGGGVAFGIYTAVLVPGTLSVGDTGPRCTPRS